MKPHPPAAPRSARRPARRYLVSLTAALAVILAAFALTGRFSTESPESAAGKACMGSCKCFPSASRTSGVLGAPGASGITGAPGASRAPGAPATIGAAEAPGAAEAGTCPESERYSTRPGDGRPVKAPNPWFFLERAYPFGRIDRALWREAQAQARALREAGGTRGSWEFRGPTNIGGRITDLAIDPTQPAIVFAGAAEGGVLRTTDSGQHWTPLFDHESVLSIGAVALDPVNPQVVYAGTGEVNPGGGSVAYGGDGVFRSTDSGATWSPLGLDGTGSIGRIRIDPTNPQRIFVAAMGDLWSAGPSRGVYRTTDGGLNWSRVLYLSDSTGAVDLVMRPDQPNTIFAAMWERIRRPDHYQYGGSTCGVYKTTDGGDHWNLVGGGLPVPSDNGGRIGLSLCTGSPANLVAVYADFTGYFAGVYKSTNGGDNWTRTSDSALSDVFSSYGWWFGNIRLHPTDPNRLFVLGLDFYRSTNGGSTWSNTGYSMHVDHHAMEFGPGASPVIYEGNDGGLYRSTNGGSVWTFLPDQPITQLYRLAATPQNPNILYAGAQDNGTVRTLTGALNDWTNVYGGDGFGPVIDFTNSNRVWAQYQYGSLAYSNNGGGSWVDATGGISYSDRFNWNTAVRMDPSNPNRLYYGTQRVYRSTNGTTWSAISPDLTGGPGEGNQGQVYGTLTTIDVSPLDGNVIWAGSDDGHVQVTTNGGTNWLDRSGALPDRWVTSVRTSPLTREVCCVTISGFRWNSPLPHIFRTTDLGVTWTPIAGNLPEAPANDVAFDPADPQRLFVATDVGVYETANGGQTWSVLGGDLPNVVVTQLYFQTNGRKLIAATYGRSFFSYQVDQPSSVEENPPLAGLPAGAVFASPNPVRDEAWISWKLPGTTPAGALKGGGSNGTRLEIYSVAGRRIWSGSGLGERVRWNRLDASGRRVSAGTYLLRLTADEKEIARGRVVVE